MPIVVIVVGLHELVFGRLSTNGCHRWFVVHTTDLLHHCTLPGYPPVCCIQELCSPLLCGPVDHICSSLLCILFLCRLPFLVLCLFLAHSCWILCSTSVGQLVLFLCLVLRSHCYVVHSPFLCCLSFLYSFLSFLCFCSFLFLCPCWRLLCPSVQLLHCSLLQHWMMPVAGVCWMLLLSCSTPWLLLWCRCKLVLLQPSSEGVVVVVLWFRSSRPQSWLDLVVVCCCLFHTC